MANMVYTNDGKSHIIFGSKDIIDIIDEYIGRDVSQYINALITEAEIEKEELEFDRDKVAWCFDDFVHEMKDEIECLQELVDKERTKKADLNRAIKRVYNKVLNQL